MSVKEKVVWTKVIIDEMTEEEEIDELEEYINEIAEKYNCDKEKATEIFHVLEGFCPKCKGYLHREGYSCWCEDCNFQETFCPKCGRYSSNRNVCTNCGSFLCPMHPDSVCK